MKPIRKVLVFTAFADTARYLWEHLATPIHDARGIHTALVAGSGGNRSTLGKTDFEHILANFSPRSKGRNRQPDLPQDEEIELLIATDCISEGQNIQDCDLLINYDLHYRDKQLKRLQNEILDLEDLDEETISLADFSLADFRLDLLRFLEANREELESSPLGLYAVVPPDPQLPATRPGILFCLRQRGDKQPKEVNPLAPHYLVYVLDDGNVRLTFAQPKQSLEIFRTLAADHPSALNTLCDLFDDRTKNGTDMVHENALLEKAVESIKATFGKRAATALLAGRDGKLPSAADVPSSQADLELVTWLVIANPTKHPQAP